MPGSREDFSPGPEKELTPGPANCCSFLQITYVPQLRAIQHLLKGEALLPREQTPCGMLHDSTGWCWGLSCHPQDSSGHDALPRLTSPLLCLMPWCSPVLEMSWERAIPLTVGAGCRGEGMPFLCRRDAGLRISRPTSFYCVVKMPLLTCSTFVLVHLMCPFQQRLSTLVVSLLTEFHF